MTFHMTVWRDACATELSLLANEVPHTHRSFSAVKNEGRLDHLEIQQENHHISSTNLTQHGNFEIFHDMSRYDTGWWFGTWLLFFPYWEEYSQLTDSYFSVG